GLARTESSAPLAEAILAPGLNFRGVEGGHVGAKAANAIPTEARASMDFRLVPDQNPDRVRQRVEEFVTKKGFFVVRGDPDTPTRLAHGRIARMNWGAGYPGERTAMDLPLSRAVVDVVRDAASTPPVLLPSFGGSLPLYVFREVLGAPIIGLPIAN